MNYLIIRRRKPLCKGWNFWNPRILANLAVLYCYFGNESKSSLTDCHEG